MLWTSESLPSALLQPLQGGPSKVEERDHVPCEKLKTPLLWKKSGSSKSRINFRVSKLKAMLISKIFLNRIETSIFFFHTSLRPYVLS